MVERITSRRSTLRTLPALREEALPRPRAQRMCRGVHTESSADRSEMGKIDRSRRRSGCAGALRHKICTASLVNRPLIDGFVFRLDSALVGFAEQPSIPEGVMHQAGGVFHQTALRFYPGNLVNGMLERGLNRR